MELTLIGLALPRWRSSTIRQAMQRCPLPQTDRIRITRSHGDPGRRWTDSLAALAGHYAAEWDLTLGGYLGGGLVSCPLECRDAAGGEMVLKLIPPWGGRKREAAALTAWNGCGAVAIRAVGTDAEALLLERVRPGRALGAEDADALELVADLGAALHGTPLPADEAFPSQAEAVARYLADNRELARRSGWPADALIDRAAVLAEKLWTTAARRGLLHGDMMDKNLLSLEPEAGHR